MTNLEKIFSSLKKIQKTVTATTHWTTDEFEMLKAELIETLKIVCEKEVDSEESKSLNAMLEVDKKVRSVQEQVKSAWAYADAMLAKAIDAKNAAKDIEKRLKENLIRELEK